MYRQCRSRRLLEPGAVLSLWQVLQAVGQPMVVMPLLMMATNTVKAPEEGPFASALINTTRSLAAPVGIGILQLIERWRVCSFRTPCGPGLTDPFSADARPQGPASRRRIYRKRADGAARACCRDAGERTDYCRYLPDPVRVRRRYRAARRVPTRPPTRRVSCSRRTEKSWPPLLYFPSHPFPSSASPPIAAKAARSKGRLRRLWPWALASLIVLAFLGVVAWRIFAPHPDARTDSYYVRVHYAAIALRVSGQVITVHVQNDDMVRAGQVLVELDDRDHRAAVASAEETPPVTGLWSRTRLRPSLARDRSSNRLVRK